MSMSIFFGTMSEIFKFIWQLLPIPGFWLLFNQCGLKGWTALVPFYRDYQLSKCAHDEEAGRKLVTTTIIYGTAEGVYTLLQHSLHEKMSLILGIIIILFMILTLIYELQIYDGLCKVFGRNKIWMLAWLFMDGLTALIWGVSPKFTPNIKAGLKIGAPDVVGKAVEKLDDGLTINLKDRHVQNYFHRKYLLKDIRLNVKPGSLVLLLGGSGAGKSTFVNAITGYEKSNAKMYLNGKNIYRDYRKLKYDIGLVPQADLMRDNDTVYSTLSDAASMRMPVKVSREDKKKRVNEVMDFIGLETVKDSLVSKLSGGQKKRLSIAIEMVSDPMLFILDEPDSGLDGVIARELMEKLRDIANKGHIVMVITHTPDRVRDLFDSVIILAKDSKRTGRLAYYGPVQKAMEFFGKDSMERILLAINPKDEGGEGRSDEFIEKYNAMRESGEAYSG